MQFQRPCANRKLLPIALAGLVLAVGCAANDDGVGVGNVIKASPTATPTPGSGSPSPSPTPSPTPSSDTSSPSPTPSPTPTTVSGGMDTTTTPAPLPTLNGGDDPTPTATPVGTLSETFAVPGAKSIAVAPNSLSPWVLGSGGAVMLDGFGSRLETYSTGLSQPNLLASADAGELWIANAGSNELHLITQGLVGRTREASFPIPAAPVAIAADATEAWTAHTDGSLQGCPRTGGTPVTGSVPGTPTAIALHGSDAWVTGQPNKLYRVSRATGTVLATFTVGSQPVAVGVDGSGTVWTANQGDSTLSRLPSGASQPASIALAGAPAALAVDTNRVWVGLAAPKQACWYALSGAPQGSVALPDAPGAMAIDAYGRVWFVAPGTGHVLYAWGR